MVEFRADSPPRKIMAASSVRMLGLDYVAGFDGNGLGLTGRTIQSVRTPSREQGYSQWGAHSGDGLLHLLNRKPASTVLPYWRRQSPR
jgi:hypothetical protein